jgi:nucleoside-diphosphate-sugar epimerase
MPNTLLIFGGNGFIGKALEKEFLKNSWKVQKFKSRIPNFIEIEQEILKIKKESGSPLTLLNAAWSPKPSNKNRHAPEHIKWIEFTSELVNLANRCEINYYGIGSGLEKADFNDAYFQAKKHCSEIVVQNSTQKNTLNMGWLRPHYVYSLNPPAPTLIRNVAEQLSKSNSVEILSNNSHDYVSIDQCVAQIYWAVSNGVRGIVDIGSGELTSNMNLVKKLFPNIPIRSITITNHDEAAAQFTGKANIEWIDRISKS